MTSFRAGRNKQGEQFGPESCAGGRSRDRPPVLFFCSGVLEVIGRVKPIGLATDTKRKEQFHVTSRRFDPSIGLAVASAGGRIDLHVTQPYRPNNDVFAGDRLGQSAVSQD